MSQRKKGPRRKRPVHVSTLEARMSTTLKLIAMATFLVLSGVASLSADIFPERSQSVVLEWPDEEDPPTGGQPRITVRAPSRGISATARNIRNTVRIVHPDDAQIIKLCGTEHIGLSQQHCGKYEYVIIPLSVSVWRTGMIPIGELTVDVEIVQDGHQPPQANIVDILPDDKKTSGDIEIVPINVTVGARSPGLSYGSSVQARIDDIQIPISSIRSGHGGDFEARWVFSERNLSGDFEMVILSSVNPAATYRLKVECVVRDVVGIKNMTHHFEVSLEFPGGSNP